MPLPHAAAAMLATIILMPPSIALAGDLGAIECRFDTLRLCTPAVFILCWVILFWYSHPVSGETIPN